MAQFRVYRIGAGKLVLDLQTDFIDTGSRVIAPLTPLNAAEPPARRLEPVFEVLGEPMVLNTADMAGVPATFLTEPVADLRAHDYEIRGALDMVFSGF